MEKIEVIGQDVNTADINAIKKLIKDTDTTWNNRDAEAFAALFEEHADFQFHTGNRVQGRSEIERSWGEDVFPGMLPGLRHIGTVKRIRFIRDDVALCDGELKIVELTEDQEHIHLDTQATVVVVKKDACWYLSCVRLIVFDTN